MEAGCSSSSGESDGRTSTLLLERLSHLAREAHELHVPSCIPVLLRLPSAVEFYREYVATSRPCVFDAGVLPDVAEWPAHTRWSQEYLCDTMGESQVSVEVTPTGKGDAIHNDLFIMPDTQRMTMKDFFSSQHAVEPKNPVLYLSHQCSNLTDELFPLLKDVSIPQLGREAFGNEPDATNIWIGPDNATTSTHKDHYENFYTVVRGKKRFVLYAPTDAPFLHHKEYHSAQYKQQEDGSFGIVKIPETESGAKRLWVSVDPETPNLQEHPLYEYATPIVCEVSAGQTLYLPSLWFHHVTQFGDPDLANCTLAVNFWFDMKYGPQYSYFRAVEALAKDATR